MFLYQKIFKELEDKIHSNTYCYGSLLPSEREIGELYNVERTTVRKAIGLLVEHNLVEKRAGKGTVVTYQQKNATTSPSITKGVIAFLLPKEHDNTGRIASPFYWELFVNLEVICKEYGYSLIYTALDKHDDLSDFIDNTNQQFVGVVFVSNINDSHIDYALKAELPSVLVNNISNKIPSIISDNFQGTFTACEHLIQKGHTDIGIINGISSYKTATDRMHGVVSAMQAHNLPIQDEFIINTESWDTEDGYQAVCNFIANAKKLPTAFVAFNDRLAIGAMQALQQAGIKIPDEISIIGYDNDEYSKYSVPKLSTVEINITHIAHLAFFMLLNQLNEHVMIPAKTLIPTEFIERDSVKILH